MKKQIALNVWLKIVFFALFFCLTVDVSPTAAATFGNLVYTDTGTSITITGSLTITGPITYFGSLDIPATINAKPVTIIGSQAFLGCSGLTSISIPSSVTSIGEAAFNKCSDLTSISVDASNLNFSSTDGILFDKGQTTLVQFPAGKVGSYSIPSSVTSIGNYAFSDCRGLTSISIPSSVTSIGRVAFFECSGLTSISIPSSVTSIGNSAFLGCSGLTGISVDVWNTNFSSTDGILFNKRQTTLIQFPEGKVGSCSIPSSVTSIGISAFTECRGLTGISVDASNLKFSSTDGILFDKGQTTLIQFPSGKVGSCSIPPSVTSIGNSAIFRCSGLTSISIPPSVTSIGNSEFRGCSDLTSISVDASNLNFSSTDGVLFDKGQTTLIQFPAGKVGSYSIPSSVTSIGNCAFLGCSGLTSIFIPSSVTSIGGNALFGCSGLTSIFIPSSVTSIGGGAFYGCIGLAGISVDASNLNFSSTDGILFDKGQTTLIQFPAGKVGSCSIPSSVTSIEYRAFIDCIRLTSISVDVSNPNFSSTDGILFDKGQTTLIQFPAGKVGSCSIPSSVTSIGNSAFRGCSDLTSISVDASNLNFSSTDGVLFDKGQTTLIQFPAGKVGSYSIPSSVTSIGNCAFLGCSGLTGISVDVSNPNFSSTDGILFNKGQTTLIQFPAGKVGSYSIPSSVTSIGGGAFFGCVGLTSISIPSSLASIGIVAFRGCSGLTSISIPSSVTRIESYAFSECSCLKNAYFIGNAPTIGRDVFGNRSSSVTVHYFNSSTGFSSPFWNCYPSIKNGE